MAVKPHGLANRPGKPYPATFRNQWTHRESNSDLCHARAVSSRWTMSPFAFSGPAGESNPDLLGAGQASSRWTSRPCQRSVRESNPAFRLTKAVCNRSTYRPSLFVAVIPDGIEPSLSCMSRRRLSRWTTGSDCQ
jgi:hypothetical protein